VTTEGSALVLIVPFFGTVEVVLGAEVVAIAEVATGAEVAETAGAYVLDWVGGVIVTPFSAQSSTAIWTAAVECHRSAGVDQGGTHRHVGKVKNRSVIEWQVNLLLKSAVSQAALIFGVSASRKPESSHTHVMLVLQPVVLMAATAGSSCWTQLVTSESKRMPLSCPNEWNRTYST
jgi:hypothetical protein